MSAPSTPGPEDGERLAGFLSGLSQRMAEVPAGTFVLAGRDRILEAATQLEQVAALLRAPAERPDYDTLLRAHTRLIEQVEALAGEVMSVEGLRAPAETRVRELEEGVRHVRETLTHDLPWRSTTDYLGGYTARLLAGRSAPAESERAEMWKWTATEGVRRIEELEALLAARPAESERYEAAWKAGFAAAHEPLMANVVTLLRSPAESEREHYLNRLVNDVTAALSEVGIPECRPDLGAHSVMDRIRLLAARSVPAFTGPPDLTEEELEGVREEMRAAGFGQPTDLPCVFAAPAVEPGNPIVRQQAAELAARGWERVNDPRAAPASGAEQREPYGWSEEDADLVAELQPFRLGVENRGKLLHEVHVPAGIAVYLRARDALVIPRELVDRLLARLEAAPAGDDS